MLWALGQVDPLLAAQTTKKLDTGDVRQWPNWLGTDGKNGLPHGAFDALYEACCLVGMCRGGEHISSLFLKWQLKTLQRQWEAQCCSVMATCTMSNKEKKNNFRKLSNKKRLHFEKQKIIPPQIPKRLFPGRVHSSAVTAALGRRHLEDWNSNNPSGLFGHRCLLSLEGFVVPKCKFSRVAVRSNRTCLPGYDL